MCEVLGRVVFQACRVQSEPTSAKPGKVCRSRGGNHNALDDAVGFARNHARPTR
jgi:hypothetical protein